MKRVDAIAKATGQALFTADLTLPRMLYGKVLRSPYPHAKIVRIDTSRAAKLPGVKAVVTGHDSSDEKWGVFRYTQDQRFLPVDKVRYIGEEVAAVAAVDEDTASEALSLIKVEYEELPAVFSMDNALKPDAPIIHENYQGNINIHVKIDVGDVEKGFKESYLVREDTFDAPEESYFQAEPYAVVARFDSSGSLEIWMPNGGPHLKSKPLANVLKMPLNKVRVRKITIGGAFGGRSEISPADVMCALLARKAQQTRQDRLHQGRKHDRNASGPRHEEQSSRPAWTAKGASRPVTSPATWMAVPIRAQDPSPPACHFCAWSRHIAWRMSVTTGTAYSPTSLFGACTAATAGPSRAA